LRAFRATADVANNGKSVIASKVAIFGNFKRQVLPILAILWIARIGKKYLALYKGCQKWQLLKTPKLPKVASEQLGTVHM